MVLVLPAILFVALTAPKQPEAKSTPVPAVPSVSQATPTNKSFYGSMGSAQSASRSNNNKVYNGGAPTGFIEPPTNIHPIASLTPYQNRYHIVLLSWWIFIEYVEFVKFLVLGMKCLLKIELCACFINVKVFIRGFMVNQNVSADGHVIENLILWFNYVTMASGLLWRTVCCVSEI